MKDCMFIEGSIYIVWKILFLQSAPVTLLTSYFVPVSIVSGRCNSERPQDTRRTDTSRKKRNEKRWALSTEVAQETRRRLTTSCTIMIALTMDKHADCRHTKDASTFTEQFQRDPGDKSIWEFSIPTTCIDTLAIRLPTNSETALDYSAQPGPLSKLF